ncbi:hypothetical protein JOM56_007104 [Amanita muscaria]
MYVDPLIPVLTSNFYDRSCPGSVWWSSLTKFSKLVVSSRLQPLLELEPPVSNTGLLTDIWSTIATDSNKKIFNMFTDEIGKTPPIGRCQVIHRSSIGRITTLQERSSLHQCVLPPPSPVSKLTRRQPPRRQQSLLLLWLLRLQRRHSRSTWPLLHSKM